MGAITLDQMLGPSVPAGPATPSVSVLPGAGTGGEKALGAFEGADRWSATQRLWNPPLQSVDSDYLPEMGTIAARSNDMLRNDAYVQGGQTLHKDNIVGSYFMPNCRPVTKVLLGKQDDTWEEEFQEEVEEKFELYWDSQDKWIDAAGQNTGTELVRLGVGVHVARGEMLASVEWLRNEPGRPFSTAINMLDLDRLSTAPDSNYDTEVRAGIRRNRFGKPIAYQISTRNPRDYPWTYGPLDWKEIAARKPWGRLQMIHLFEQVRPDQTRGIPDMAAALKEMKITRDFRDITLQRAVAQALYAAVITSELPTEQLFTQLGAINPGATVTPEMAEAAITNYAEGYLSAIAGYAGTKVDGVRVPHLFPGTDFKLLANHGTDSRGMEFEQSLLRYIAATLGVSYEQLSRDYTQTNYSSARAAMTETWKFMQARKKVVADQFASIMFRLWFEEAFNKGLIDSTTRAMRQPGWLYQGQRLDAITKVDWIGASRGQIDELKETQAAVLRINNGLSTAEDELARLGKDWRKVYRQLKREQALRETYGLVFAANDPAVMALAATPPDEGKKQ